MLDYRLIIQYRSKLFKLIIGLMCMTSCTVTNNLYVANPNPMGKGKLQNYLCIGTGVEAKIDSVNSNNGKIYFSNEISTAPILSVGGQAGVSKKTDIRWAIHFPYIIGGIGGRLGLQHSFLDSSARKNFAIGLDLGGVYARDSIRFLGQKISTNQEAKGALNADIFIPYGVKFKNDISLVLTGRYSLNRIYIREDLDYSSANRFDLGYPALSLGIRKRKYYFEATIIYYDRKIYPHLGFAILEF